MSPPLSEPSSPQAEITTGIGLRLHVRPANAADETELETFFENVTLEDLRFRFLSAVQHVGHDQITAMLRTDRERTVTLLAYEEGGALVGVAMLAADAQSETAEVAVSVHRDWKAQGIGWSLLRHVAQRARARGILRLQSIESRDNHAAIEVERDLGFTARAYAGDPTLILLEADLVGDTAPGA
ncbi:N-acetyltransferase GCN5 [Sphingobium sp. C100]|uniref:GNAT family N-acetyltransferase n=1 Tax=Sphingobium sp. C100 TaxID=1207055 RepID=UPI0003D6371B|nr:GNAT family N-acetyltransferase [Sphingobium sp. C100]ETI64546.1 N-acetyltransferase GCN5 [Sphingobium sp. C100]